jgi:hypothetical protein
VSLLGLHLIDFVGLSAIAARSFAPTRTDPADRIHGWIELGWGIFFFHYRLPKVGTEIQPPLKTPGALVLLPLYQESLTRLDCLSLSRLIYLFFFVLFGSSADKKQSGIFSTTTSGPLGNKNWLYMYTGHGRLFLFLSSSLRPCVTFGREG